MAEALPVEVLDSLIHSLPSRELWSWLNEDSRQDLRLRITQGFRATAEVLRQPIATTRLVKHLEDNESDADELLKLWGKSSTQVLKAIREHDDSALVEVLSTLRTIHSGEALILALLHDEREPVLEAWMEQNGIEVEKESTSAPNFESLQKQLTRAQSKVEELRTKARETKAQASITEKHLKEKLREQETIARSWQREARQLTLKVEVLEGKLQEADKARDRAERKAKSTLAESETAQTQLKTAQRQLHRLQQINEALRSQLAASKTQFDDIKTPRPQEIKETFISAEAKPASVSRPRALTPSRSKDEIEKIKAAIDRNDEAFIATLRAELSTLHKRDAKAYSELLKRVRVSGRNYEKVLTAPTTRVLVDASNVARYETHKKGKLKYLLAMREELQRHEFFPIIFVADASLPHFIDEPKKLREMIVRGEVLITESGQTADEVLTRQARETGAYVVTNDRNFHFAYAPDFTPSRIGFRIEEGVLRLDEY